MEGSSVPSPELAGSGTALPAVQEWYRAYSDHLAISYVASGRLTHAVTKGETREDQVLAMLRLILPTRHVLERRVVILSATGAQSPSFDGALIDRSDWPLLYSESGTVAAMVESVVAALEVKSGLDSAEMTDIFGKTAGLHSLPVGFPSTSGPAVAVTAFAYQCANPYLSYFDFAASTAMNHMSAPREICILNRGIFCHTHMQNDQTLLAHQADRQSTPVFLPTEKDSLLLWVYMLCRWSGGGAARPDLFRRYSESLFSGARAYHFAPDFLDVLRTDAERCAVARQCFARRADRPFDELYDRARKAINL